MAAIATRPTTSRLDGIPDRSAKSKQTRTDIWTSLLKQTQVAQSRNRSNAIANREIIVCGGSPEDQRQFLASLARPPPPQPLRKARNDKLDQKPKGNLALSNRYAYGYGHISLFSAQQGGIGSAALGSESEEVARLQCHCIPEPDITYENVLRRILRKQYDKPDTVDQDDVYDNNDSSKPIVDDSERQSVVQILLSWKQPWKFLQQIRAWLQLFARAIAPDEGVDDFHNTIQVLIDHNVSITVVVQHVEAQQELEREGWTEETFDYVCQVLRTVLLPLHPFSALVYTPSVLAIQQSGSSLTEIQKVVFSSLDLDIASLSPRPSSSGSSGGTLAKKEDLLPRHNVVDRMNIVIPKAWDSAGKVRLLSETFSPEDVIKAWAIDMVQPVFPTSTPVQVTTEAAPAASNVEAQQRQPEEVFSAEPSSPVSTIPSLPPSPSKTAPSAMRLFEAQVVDANAHKAPKAVTVNVVARPEQEFLKEMKIELDTYTAKDREKTGSTTGSPAVNRIVGVPLGESTGALDSLGDVSFNIGGVNYNSTSAEAAIERLKRPHAPGVDVSSPSTASRTSTPRPPRRMESDRDATPGVTTPSTNRADFPSEDLEKYFASLAKKAGGVDSRQGTPSRHT